MDYYNTIPSGPSSRPYNPNSSMSPTFPSYPLMTDNPYDNPHQSQTQHQQHPHHLQHQHQPQDPSSHSMQIGGNHNLDLDLDLDLDNAEVESGIETQQASEGGQAEYDDTAPLVEPHQSLDSFLESFWTRQMGVVERDNPDFRTYPLPLARIKKVMKSDEEVKVGQNCGSSFHPYACTHQCALGIWR